MNKEKFLGIGVFLLMVLVATITFGAYSSHQNDQDVTNILAVYPYVKNTKLDDCSMCHPGGSITTPGIPPKQDKTVYYGSCDWCHMEYGLQTPHEKDVPLNAFGQAYLAGGRSEQALRDIASSDSDGDGFTNFAEFQALTFPGTAADKPGLVQAPAVVMNLERILDLNSYSQFMFSNHSKGTDEYARYRGVKMTDLLKAVQAQPGATHITVFAPDGFSKTFPIDTADPQTEAATAQYDVKGPYPTGTYYKDLPFVSYTYDPGYSDGAKMADKLHMLFAYLRDGDPLTKGRLIVDPANPARLVLDGEGPYRLVVPQKIAGSPDRASTAATVGDGWDFSTDKDHNAGFAVRSVTAIRVEPLPTGTTDFQWTEGGWNLVDKARLVIYGAINPRTYPVNGLVVDGDNKPLAGVKLSLGLVSLGQVGETVTGTTGKFHTGLPLGEYVVIPTKDDYLFEPESIAIQLSDKEGYKKMSFTGTPAVGLR